MGLIVSKRASTISYAIRDLVVPAQKIEAQGHKVLKLNIGDPDVYDFDVPEFIKDAACKAIRGGKNFYANSEGDKRMREAVVRKHKRDAGYEFDVESVLACSGVSEGLFFLFGSLLDHGDEVLIPSPAYPLYLSVPKYFGGVPVEYECSEENNWQPNLTDLESKITQRTKAIVLINPNNPTGANYSKKTVEDFVELAARHDIPIIADEIYDKMVYSSHTSVASVAGDTKFVLCNGVSKVYLAPGWRVGYLAFSPGLEELHEACCRLARLRLCSNTPCQVAFAEALDGPHDHVIKTMKKLNERRKFFTKRVNEIEGLSCVEPQGAFYAFPKIEGCVDDKSWVLDLLHEKHVLVVNGSGFGAYGAGHFRSVYLPPVSVLEDALDRIDSFTHLFHQAAKIVSH